MGLIHARITLKNPRNAKVKSIDVEALVDSGSLHLCLPQHIQMQLKLDAIDQKEVTVADGTRNALTAISGAHRLVSIT